MISNMVTNPNEFIVIHPLNDQPEEKLTGEGLGKISLSRSVRISLFLLRIYSIFMSILLTYHLLDLSGILGHHTAK